MKKNAKAHGMDGTLVEPDWPPLTLGEVSELLHQYPAVSEPILIEFASPRPFSAAAVVKTAKGEVFVKRHHRLVRDCEGLLEEHRFIAHLRANRVVIPRVIENGRNETSTGTGDWTYEVHEILPDVDLYREAVSWSPFRSMAHAHSAGRILANLHRASESYAAPPRKVRPLVSSFTIFAATNTQDAMNRYLAARPALHGREFYEAGAEALDLLAPFEAELKPSRGQLRPLWTHNDLHPSNLLWSGTGEAARATAIIDFGLADRTNAVHDLALAIERSIVEWLVLTRVRQASMR